MSHELRTPLNAVIGFSEVLLDRMFGELNERRTSICATSGTPASTCSTAQRDPGPVEGRSRPDGARSQALSASPAPWSTRWRWSASGRLPHAITVTVQVADDVDTIDADELRFKQVVLNLVSNAVKFTPDGGSVAIRAYREGTELVVTVTDTGIGVPPEDQERIFESFQQGGRGAPKEEGTGLGLTLSRRIVGLFGGADVARQHAGRRKHVRLLDPGPAGAGGGPPRRPDGASFPSSSSSTTTGRRWISSRPTSTARRFG